MATLQAPVGLMEGRRRRLRPGHVLVTIEDLLILTWEVPVAELRRHLPLGLEPWSRGSRARLSALLFRNRGLRPARLGVPRLSSAQLNLRSYILDPTTGRPGSVFFHGLFLGGRWLARISSRLFGVPFRALPFKIHVVREGERISLWQATSPDGSLRVQAIENGGHDRFDSETLDLLTNPHSGVVQLPGRRGLKAWSIWHRNQTLRTMAVEEALIRPLEETEIIRRENVSGLFVDSVDYEVYLPARPVSAHGVTS